MKKQKTTVCIVPHAFWAALLLGVFTFPIRGQDGGAAQPQAEEKKSKWERSASLGLTVTQGNSDTLLLTSNILGIRKWDQNEIRLGADGTYGEIESTTSTESVHGFAQYNRLFLNDRAFGYARVDALHDGITDVDYRLTIGPGAGYYFIKSEKTTLSAEAGPSFVFEKQGGAEHRYGALRLAERFERRLNDRARLWQSAEVLPQVDDLDNFLIIGEIGIEADLTKKLSLRAFIQDTYDNAPAAGRKENDVKLVTALGYKF